MWQVDNYKSGDCEETYDDSARVKMELRASSPETRADREECSWENGAPESNIGGNPNWVF